MDEYLEKFSSSEDIFDKARIVDFLIKEKNFRVKDIALKLGVSSSYICHLQRILKLPDTIIDGYYSNVITISHLFILSRINDNQKIIKIYEKILADNLTIQQTENLIREELYGLSDKGDRLKKEELVDLVSKFNKKFPEVMINIVQTRRYGKIFINIKGNLEKTSKLIKKIISEVL